jgi:hypothetical protein
MAAKEKISKRNAGFNLKQKGYFVINLIPATRLPFYQLIILISHALKPYAAAAAKLTIAF